MEAVARLKNCPMSARKMRIVADNVRGVEVNKALGILRFTKREASVWIEKTLLSAIANWEVKTGNNADDHGLYVKTIFVDGGAMLKRFRPAPHGRAHRIRKRTNHLTIIVASKEEVAENAEVEAVAENAEA